MSIYNLRYINEAYKSKYASYFDNDNDEDDDDDDDEDDEPKKSNASAIPSKPLVHLTTQEIYRLMGIVKTTLSQFSKIKKCCDFIDIIDKCEIDDDGNRASAIDLYKKKSPTSFIKTIEGDVWSGYPNFKDGGQDDYENDSKDFVKAVNDKIKSLGTIRAKFTTGSGDDEAISYGFKSCDINK